MAVEEWNHYVKTRVADFVLQLPSSVVHPNVALLHNMQPQNGDNHGQNPANYPQFRKHDRCTI